MARPREFEADQAARDLMQVFWRKGYDGTSLQDIEIATGLKKQSLYRAFGDKRAMYLAALDAYERDEIAEGIGLLRLPGSAHDRFDRLFGQVIDHAIDTDDRWGCFMCNASVDQAPLDEAICKRVAAMIARVQSAFEEALTASAPFDVNETDRRSMARMLLAGYFGLRVLIKAGSPRDALTEAKNQLLARL